MSEPKEPMSAFAMYNMKRKNMETSLNAKKVKKKRVSFKLEVTEEEHGKQEKAKQKSTAVKKTNKVVLRATRNMGKKNNLKPKQTGVSITIKKKKPIKQVKMKSVKDKKVGLTKISTEKDTKRKVKSSAKNTNLKVPKVKQAQRKQPESNKNLTKKVQQLDISSVPCLSTNFEADTGNHENPLMTSQSMFSWLIHPMNIDDFIRQNWEKTPVHIKRNFPNYYKFLMSTPLLDKILRESHILFTKNIDITSYENGERETHNPPGRAVPTVVWDYYMNGCSVRMLNPQTYIPKLHSLNATLQEFFGCFVGANSYLTPPNSQGFAPHYDDIEAFILQVEGKKRWRLYKPLHANAYLPRYSSKNFDQSEIGEPILDTVVNAGDLLYFPRGTIHQGETIDDTHSLHITLSVYQKNSWGDLLEKLLPDALRKAMGNDSEFRTGLPLDYLRYSGLVHSANQTSVKEVFKEKVKSLLNQLIDYVDIDKAADLMAKNHIHDFLPPALSECEQECSVVQDGEHMIANGIVENRVEIEPDTKIRLLRSHCTRLIEEENVYRIYYSCENSKEYHEYEPQFLEVSKDFVPAVREIILRYPEFIRVEDLPLEGEDNKIQIVKDLWEKCIVVTDKPLCVIE